MAIVIKKKVSLDFLGEDYKDAYLTFRSIPAIDFDEILAQLQDIEKKKEKSLGYILGILKTYFVKGEFPNDDGTLEVVKAEDLDGLDPISTVNCFKVFTGQELDPKDETPLTSLSTMADNPPENL